MQKMAKSKIAAAETLTTLFVDAPPANPAPSAADKVFLRGLKKRGYTEQEIISIAAKGGYQITPDLFVIKPRKAKLETAAGSA